MFEMQPVKQRFESINVVEHGSGQIQGNDATVLPNRGKRKRVRNMQTLKRELKRSFR